MNDLQRSAKLPKPMNNERLPSLQTCRKVAIWLLGALILSVMIVWFGFLGWGIVGLLQWALNLVKHFWTAYL
jgi:hypothetical protein